MHVMAAMGCDKEIKEAAFEPQNAVTRHYKTGRAELILPLKGMHQERYGQPYLHIHRADLHHILRRSAEASGVAIHLDAAVQTILQDEAGVSISAGGDQYQGDILVGADGVRSTVCRKIFGERQPRFTGQVAWRGTVDASRLPEGTIPPDANAWLGPGRHFVSYYVRGGALINFVAVEERGVWTEEGWNIAGDVGDVRAAFDGWDPRIQTLLGSCTSCFLWGLFDHPPLASWTQSRAALLGDACHPMLPFMAQGAAMAIEDAFALTGCVGKTHLSLEERLKLYENKRQGRTTLLQTLSRDNARLFHLSSPLAVAARRAKFWAASHVPPLAHMRFDKIYGHNVTGDSI